MEPMYFQTDLFVECMEEYFNFTLIQKQQLADRFVLELYRQISLCNKHLSEGEIQIRTNNLATEVCNGVNLHIIQMHAKSDMLNSEALGFVNTIWVKNLFDYIQCRTS